VKLPAWLGSPEPEPARGLRRLWQREPQAPPTLGARLRATLSRSVAPTPSESLSERALRALRPAEAPVLEPGSDLSQALKEALAPALRSLRPRRQRPPRPGRGSRLRARVLLSFLLLGYGLLAYRLYQIQHVQHEEWSQRARSQHVRVLPIAPERGRIMMRDGEREVPVAVSVRRGSLMIEGRKGRDVDAFLVRLRSLVGELGAEEEREVRRRLASGRAFYFRRHQLDADTLDRIDLAQRSQATRLERAQVEVEPVRTYPFGPLAAQVLGLVDGHQRGGTGIEARCEQYLRGTPGEREVQIDRKKRELVGLEERVRPARAGADVYLTIDRSIQQVVDEELARLGREHSPVGAAVVVVDPRTGDVLAMSSWPTYDAGDPGRDYAKGQHNRAIQHGYEPGSTIKPLLVGMAWQLGLGYPDRLIHCPRTLRVPGRRKPIVDSHLVGSVIELQVLVQSSNTGAFQISSRLSFAQVRQTLAAFGLGRRSGLPLPAEIAGDTRSLAKMNKAHLAAVAQGYAVMVTPLQMAMAYAALANGGTLLAPRLVREVRDRGGRLIVENDPRALSRPLTGRITEGAIRLALSEVVNGKGGTARRARSKLYTVAGKTGTTKWLTPQGRYHEREVVASFCGFAPAERPRLAFSVVAWAPSTKKKRAWGGTVAAPCAGRVVDRALRLLRVPPSPKPAETKTK
jgi:cell division protein FtsI/penicillin-binding protein 2